MLKRSSQISIQLAVHQDLAGAAQEHAANPGSPLLNTNLNERVVNYICMHCFHLQKDLFTRQNRPTTKN